MAHKTSTIGRLSAGGLEGIFTLKRAAMMALGLALVGLVVALTLVAGPALLPQASPGILAGVEASSARWAAVGTQYAPDYEHIAAVSSARWGALGEYFSGAAKAGRADAARWNALAVAYGTDYEQIASVSSARWSALAAHHSGLSKGQAADAARWNALAVAYAPDYEHIASVSSARWSALGSWYASQSAEVR